MSVTANVIPFPEEPASFSGSSQVLPVPDTTRDLTRLEAALRARNVLVAHYGRHWLLASSAHPHLAIVLDPTSPTLEYQDLDGHILSGHLITLCERERVEFIAATVGAK